MTLQTKPVLFVPSRTHSDRHSAYLRFSAPYLLPTLEVFWAILTFSQSRVTKLWHMYLLRALVGFFEAPSFGGTHLIRESSRLTQLDE